MQEILAFTLPLSDVSARLLQVGGKGASLARMARAGLPVPPGFHVTTAAYRRFVAANELQGAILAALSAASADDPSTLENASQQIGKLFADGVIPDEIVEAICQAYAELGGGGQAVAVRSSATAEDLPGLSFAGQQETYLNIRGETMVLSAVKRCWASLWTARAIGYRARHNIAQEDVSLAVVVQELVPADAAGILFTANPLTGARDQVMINAAWGLGEAIVGGQVTPDTVVVDKASGKMIEQEVASKDVMTVCTAPGTHEEAVPAESRTQAVLNSAQVAELSHLGVRIEQLYGQPMDIEWAMQGGQFFVVQARPITTLRAMGSRPRTAPEGDWTPPKPKGPYLRVGVIELLPDPLSPLFATLGLSVWNAVGRTLAEQMGPAVSGLLSGDFLITIRGYAYLDLTFTRTAKMLLWLPGYPSFIVRTLRSARTRWEQEAHPAYLASVQHWKATDVEATPATHLLEGVRELLVAAAQYCLTIQGGILPAAYLSEALFTLVYTRLIKRRSDPSALTFLLGYDSAPIRAEQSLYDLAQWTRGQAGLVDVLMGMSGNEFAVAYRSGQVVGGDAGVWAAFQHRFAAHLTRFGHMIYDLDFAKAVPADDPSSLLSPLKFFLSGEAPDPSTRQAQTAAAREQAVQKMLTRLHGLRRSWFQRLVQPAQRFAPLREDALADVGLGWPVLRRMLREIGRRLVKVRVIDTPDEVFWLTQDEVQALAAALDADHPLADQHAIVAKRRATWESERALTPPVALPLKGGARVLGIQWRARIPARSDQPAGEVIRGVAASPGRVTGLARVIAGPLEFGQMQRGEILVARITTPAWTPLFALAAGVVTDVGGPLSHSSIVAREYHIPAVLGTGVATARLHSSQRITVDGDAGTVATEGERV